MLSVSKQLQVHVNHWKDSTEILAIFYSLKYLHRFRYTDVTFLSAERFEREMNVFCEIAMCNDQRYVMSCCVNTLVFFCFASISLCCAYWVIPVMKYLKKTAFKKWKCLCCNLSKLFYKKVYKTVQICCGQARAPT